MGWGAHGNPVFRNLQGVSSLETALWRDGGLGYALPQEKRGNYLECVKNSP